MNSKVLRNISDGLYLLTARNGERYNGCIINTLERVTTTPNKVTISVIKENLTHDLIVKAGEFNISIFSETATFDTLKHFGFQTGREIDKFADFPYEISQNGLPYITKGTNGFLSAKVFEKIDLGTHTLFIADVTDGETLCSEPSATYAYYQKNIKEAPSKEAKGWVCKICGYVYPHETLPADFICPLCKHGVSDFEKQ